MAILDIQSLDLMFNCLGNLTSTIFWVRNADYSQLLYISESYETLYGRSCEHLYNHPHTWSDILTGKDRNLILDRIGQRVKNQLVNNEDYDHILYQVNLASGEQKSIKNNCFPLRDPKGNILAFIGLSESISEQEWHKLSTGPNNDSVIKTKKLASDIGNLICRDLLHNPEVMAKAIPQPKAMPATFNASTLALSRRERECLSLLLKGNSAKQTGRILNLSPRTIESYLDTLKRKFECRTKFEMISKLQLDLVQF